MIELSREMAIGNAHSKFILIGEHAVVYGEPAIAIPFSKINVLVKVEPISGSIEFVSDFYTGSLKAIPLKLKGFAVCIEAVCQQLGKPLKDFKLKLNSSIPIGRGLGSSAAIAIAIVRGLFNYFNQKLTNENLLNLVEIAEMYAHGTPSGIDMTAASSDQPIWFRKNKAVQSVQIKHPFHFVIADSGRSGDTHAAVASINAKYLTEQVKTEAAIAELGALARQAQEALRVGSPDSLGEVMDEAQEQLSLLGVSDPGLDELVQVSNKAGALGSKLTGGGRGGCIIALAPSEAKAKVIATALMASGAKQTWHCTI